MIDETLMRRAIATRDRNYDGRFVYAVVTTGVYCRPSCAARRARPENLRFFPAPGEAAAAGYRACKRCRPDEAVPDLDVVVDIARYLEAHVDERVTLDALAGRAGMSVSRLQRRFKALFGVTPRTYQDGLKLRGFKAALQSGDNVTGAIQRAGFASTSRVYGDPAHHIGMTPSAYRAGGSGESIAYAARDTALGTLLMAATDRGVCFAQFGEDCASLERQLRAEFPKASLQPSAAADSADLDAWLDALEAHLTGGAPRPELPLDLRGTAFQMQVWRFLLGVREGDVVSYAEVAEGIGRPRAVRAAAAACAANRVAVLVPCHRVLRGDGSLGGYRWGTARKRALLDGERRRARGSVGGISNRDVGRISNRDVGAISNRDSGSGSKTPPTGSTPTR